jgi:hypothetical protein
MFVLRNILDLICICFNFKKKHRCPDQLARTSTSPTDPEVNDPLNLQWLSY